MSVQYVNKKCPVCGGYVSINALGHEMCENCRYVLPGSTTATELTKEYKEYIKEMAQEIAAAPLFIDADKYAFGTAVGSLEPCTLTITNCEKFKVQLRELEVEFELDPDKLENIDTLIINGYKYVKEK